MQNGQPVPITRWSRFFRRSMLIVCLPLLHPHCAPPATTSLLSRDRFISTCVS
jgi:hypothetical protein